MKRRGVGEMPKVIDRRPEGQLKERGLMISVVISILIVAVLGFTMVVAVLATQPL